jgi:hypothetical protein
MKTITTLDLELVIGGTGYPLGNIDKPNLSSGGNGQLVSTLNSIQSSLKDLSNNKNQGPFSGQNGLLFVTMLALSNQRQNNTVVYQQGGGCAPHHGFRFRIW